MTRIARAAAYAVATAAFTAAVTFSAPSLAQTATLPTAVPAVQAATPVATIPAAPAPAALDAAAAAAAPQVAAPTTALPVEEKKGLVAVTWSKAVALIAKPVQALGLGKPKSLDELVIAHAGDRTEGEEQDCLAKAVYFEARSEPLEGQLAVAQVVINRAASGRYPGTLCKVVTQPWQFSFIRKGRFPTPDFNSAAWRKAVAVARIAQGKLAGSLSSDVLWYHATYVRPSWGKRLTRTTQIGLHIFYS